MQNNWESKGLRLAKSPQKNYPKTKASYMSKKKTTYGQAILLFDLPKVDGFHVISNKNKKLSSVSKNGTS